jgi:dTMP kinase
MFVVIEGIDGAGCETQAKLIAKKIRTEQCSVPTKLIKYPDYEKNVGRLIKEFLYQNKNLSAEAQFLLYSLQFILDKEEIRKRRKNQIIIADRYFTSALCYQTLEGVNLRTALRFASDFKIEKPDLVFYLNVQPEIAIQRKFGEAKEKNRREKDFQFIKKTYEQYQKLIKNQVWTRWVEIDGERKVDEISEEIYNNLKTQMLNVKSTS